MEGLSAIPPDTNYAPKFLITCGLLLALAVGLCVTRILSRLRPTPHLSIDDYFIVTAAVPLSLIFASTNNNVFIDIIHR